MASLSMLQTTHGSVVYTFELLQPTVLSLRHDLNSKQPMARMAC